MVQIKQEHLAEKEGARAHNGCLANDRTTDGRQQSRGKERKTVKETLNLIGFFLRRLSVLKDERTDETLDGAQGWAKRDRQKRGRIANPLTLE